MSKASGTLTSLAVKRLSVTCLQFNCLLACSLAVCQLYVLLLSRLCNVFQQHGGLFVTCSLDWILTKSLVWWPKYAFSYLTLALKRPSQGNVNWIICQLCSILFHAINSTWLIEFTASGIWDMRLPMWTYDWCRSDDTWWHRCWFLYDSAFVW